MATDPWARFDSVLQKSKPPDPWKRFDAALPGPWEATASPLVQRRRMPDGSFETRPTPREGQEPAVTPADPLRGDTPEERAWKAALVNALPGAGGLAPGTAAALADVAGETARGIPARIKEGLAAMPELPTLGINFLIPSSPQGRLQADPSDIYGERGGLVRETRESVREGRAAAAERIAEAGVGLPPGVSAWADTTSEAGASVLDPANWLGVGGAAKVARAGERGLVGAGARVVDDLAEYTAEELADLAARKRGLARLPLADRPPEIPHTGPVGRNGSAAAQLDALGMRASLEDAEELRRLSLEIGETPPVRNPPAVKETPVLSDSPWSRFDDELARIESPSATDGIQLSNTARRPDVVEIPRPEPRGTAVTERGSRVDFDYEIRDASTLVTSHDDVLRPNPLYPPEVQPRERGRAASAAQVVRIEQQLNPELLGPSPRVSDGAPMVGPDGVVESGNARSIALRRAYAAESPRAGAYREWVREQAPLLGLDPAAADAVPNPVLVRVRRTDVDRAAFAREANESAVSGFSAAERAAADANLVTPSMLDSLTLQADGSVNLQTNRDFIRAFAAQVAPTEHAAMFDARGQLSLDGERRLQNAILAKAYGDPAAVAKLTEHADSNVRAVGSALMREAPRFARMREGVATGRFYPLDISGDVAAALRKLSALRDEGTKISDHLAQGSLFGSDLTPEARTLLVLFDANARSGSRVADILGRYADSVAALGDPAQGRMFGEQSVPSRLELLAAAAPPEQRALLSQAEAAYTAAGAPPPPGQSAQAILPPPSRHVPGGAPPQGDLPGIPSPSPTPFRMSTKGIENSAGLQDELHRVVEANRGEIEGARGPVVPVSQWHDAPALAEKLGLAPEDYLRRPADRGPMNADELSLGRHYLGQMKKEALELEARIAAGDVPDRAAAEAEKVARNRDVVRMMATLQSQGSSEAGRMMRSLQEALDPYGLADTPRDRVRLALLKKYKEANAGEAARLEVAAVARLQRAAARETRKAARAATSEELGAELSDLAAQFGSLSRKPRGMAGGVVPLDPELVEVVGRMAANRVRAGVVAVEELADQVYTAVARQVDGVSREQVKAAIVEHALARPGKEPQVKVSPEEARLRTAEAATASSIRELEKRIVRATPSGELHAGEVLGSPLTPAASEARLSSFGKGPPRLSISDNQIFEINGRSFANPREGLLQKSAVYRDPAGKPVAATLISSNDGGVSWKVEDLVARKEKRTLLDGRAAKELRDFLERHNATASAQSITPDALAARQRLSGSGIAGRTSAWSPKLGELKARQADIRKQLAGMHAGQQASMPARDPAAAKLRAREQALARQVEKAEARLASGPQLPAAKTAPADPPRLQELRRRLDEVRAQLAADPREGLAARYRELLDDQTVEMIAALPDPAEDPEALLDFLRQMEKPGFRDYMGAYVFGNLLSGPKSLLRNVVGNTVKRWDRVAMQPLSAGFEKVLAPLQGRLPERYVREILPAVVGSYAGAPEALKKGLWVLKNGWDPERVVAELTGVKGNAKYYEGRLPVDPFILSKNKGVRAAGAVLGYGPRMMQVGDVMARARNFSSASYAWATRTAINDVKRGAATDVAERAAQLLKDQPKEMIEYAQRVAREDTFTDEVSNVAKLFGAARREDTGVGFAMSQAVKFLNVPDRIAAWLADYTPGARLLGAAWKGGKLRKAWGTAEASDILARQAFGTALAAAAAAWAFQGKLTGNMPRDEKLKNDAFEAGKQPNSVLLGGYWIPIRDLFGGWAAPVAAAAAFHDSAMTGEEVDGEELLERVGGAALGEARFLLDAGYLSNLSDVVEGIQAEPDQAGRKVAALGARTAAGFLIPWSGLQRNAAIFLDPRVVGKEGPLDEVKAGIPGLRQTLPARIGTRGEELRQGTGAAGGILPVVPTRNRVAAPGLAEDTERLRATLAAKRREVSRIEKDLKDALKPVQEHTKKGQKVPPHLLARVQELRQSLPFSINPETGKPERVTTSRLDNIMESIRVQEQRIRKLRASGKPEDVIRRAEVEIQKRMAERLEKALAGLRSP